MKRALQSILLALAILVPSQAQERAQEEADYRDAEPLESIFMDVPFVNYPGNMPEMKTVLNVTEDFYTLTHWLLKKYIKDGFWATEATYLLDLLSAYTPLGFSWLHEEYHRSVLSNHSISSYDEINDFPIGRSVISVSHVKDEQLADLCNNYRPDFIRLMSAGLEAQTSFVRDIQRKDFFFNWRLHNEVLYLGNVTNNIAYIAICAMGRDKDIINMNKAETTIEERDFTGYDLSAWAYELFNPDRLYEERGIHPTGVGINRYILHDQLSPQAIKYLWRETFLDCLNLVSPMMLGIYDIPLFGGVVSGNFAFRHYLTSFGDDIGLEILLKTGGLNAYVTLHDYNNYVGMFPGIEGGIIEDRLFGNKISVSASAQAWLQPDGFQTKHCRPGAAVSGKLVYNNYDSICPFIEMDYKTAGWMPDVMFLDKNFSFRVGMRANL